MKRIIVNNKKQLLINIDNLKDLEFQDKVEIILMRKKVHKNWGFDLRSDFEKELEKKKDPVIAKYIIYRSESMDKIWLKSIKNVLKNIRKLSPDVFEGI